MTNRVHVFRATCWQLSLLHTGGELVHKVITMTLCDVATACGQLLQSLCTSLHTYHMSSLYR